jgi:hypothetical protein
VVSVVVGIGDIISRLNRLFRPNAGLVTKRDGETVQKAHQKQVVVKHMGVVGWTPRQSGVALDLAADRPN